MPNAEHLREPGVPGDARHNDFASGCFGMRDQLWEWNAFPGLPISIAGKTSGNCYGSPLLNGVDDDL